MVSALRVQCLMSDSASTIAQSFCVHRSSAGHPGEVPSL